MNEEYKKGDLSVRLCERMRLMFRGSDCSEGLISGGFIPINSLMS